MTLACEDANSKLVEVVAVADVAERNVLTTVLCRFGIYMNFGHKAKFCSDFEHKVWPRV